MISGNTPSIQSVFWEKCARERHDGRVGSWYALQSSDWGSISKGLATLPLFSVITRAQPKAGTGHKMQTVSDAFSTLHC